MMRSYGITSKLLNMYVNNKCVVIDRAGKIEWKDATCQDFYFSL